jgi:hypothetical protein
MDSDDDEPQTHAVQSEEAQQMPRIAQWRSNLVALSQIHNVSHLGYGYWRLEDTKRATASSIQIIHFSNLILSRSNNISD